MKTRLLGVALCLSMIISLFPALSIVGDAAYDISDSGYTYSAITDDSGSVITDWKAGDERFPDEDLYAYINGEYIKVTLGEGDLFSEIKDDDGNTITSWTAASAREIYDQNTARDDQNISSSQWQFV